MFVCLIPELNDDSQEIVFAKGKWRKFSWRKPQLIVQDIFLQMQRQR